MGSEQAGSAGPADEGDAAARLAAIVECSQDAIIGKTLDGVITCWNPGAEQLYGYTAEEVVGRHVSLLLPGDRADELDSILARLSRGERVGHFETRRVRRDGSVIDVSVCVSPIMAADGTVAGAATVARDVTERNRSAAAGREMAALLRQAERMETLGQFAGEVAHDFNNLLGAVAGYAGLITAATGDPVILADVEQIQAIIERAARLAGDLLTFSRREPAPVAPTDLNRVIRGALKLLGTSVGAQVEVCFEPSADLPAVLGDTGRLEQVLLNLAVNARDAMPGGGTLTISTSVAQIRAGDSRLRAGIAPGRFAELTVRDTGTGMSASTVAHIFEPFFTTKAAGRGTGLGLSTVYGIVAAAGGMIDVDSAPGAGTTFRLYLPLAGGPARGEPAVAGPPPPAAGGGKVILVVDDEPAMLEVTSRILRQSGYTAMEAASAEQALALAAGSDIQLLLTDSAMPGMSGAELAERVRELAPGTRVLRMSGYAPEAAGIPPEGGGAAFIQKPFSPPALLAKIGEVLAGTCGPGGQIPRPRSPG